MIVLSWNCRGLGSKSKEDAMKDLVRSSQPDLLLIQETKMEENSFLQSSLKFWKKGGGVAVSSRGASGGIDTLWDASKFDLVSTKSCTHWILTQLLHKASGTQVCLFNIYVPVLFSEKKNFVGSFFGSCQRNAIRKHNHSRRS
jgi:exonuclease III